MANQRIKANLIPSYDMINPVIHLAQYDVSDGTGKQVEIELYYGADKYTIPSGSTVTFRGTKRDKTGYSYEITKVTDNVVTVDVKPQMTVLSRTHNAELRITNGHTISNTVKFIMDIDSSALADDTKVSETQLPTIEKASQAYDFVVSVQDKVEEAKASAESAIQTKEEVEALKTSVETSETNASNSAKEAKASADSVANVVSDVSQLKEDIANIGNPTDEQVSTAVNNYLDKNPVSGLDASTAQENQVPTADGQGNWSWKTQQSGTVSEETDPTVPEWAKSPQKPTYTASEVGADASGTAESKVSDHNVSDTAHNDIRLLVQGLTERLNALADSDDTTLDQMSEIVSYIKYNRSMINGIDTNKVDVSDIINNLISNNTDKPLSAKQGRVLKSLIDAIIVPTKLSELENDSGFLTESQVNNLIDAKLTGVETLLGGGF